MHGRDQTPRQRITELLVGRQLSARELAELVNIPERQIEDHLPHIVKSVGRDRNKQFMLKPSECMDCKFVFRERRRLTCPSRCPKCRSESIMSPRFGITIDS